MTIHNYYTISDNKRTVKSCNSIAENFKSLFLSGQKLAEYFYIFYGENSVYKTKAEYLCGSIENKPYLKYTATISDGELDGQSVTAVGLGGESGYISKAQLRFVKTEKITVNAVIFIELEGLGRVLDVNFLKLIMAEPLNIKGVMLTDKEKQTSGFNIEASTPIAAQKSYSQKLKISFTSAEKKNNALLIAGDKPCFLYENLFERYGETFSTNSSNYCIDINKNIVIDELKYTSEIPLYSVQKYGKFIDKGQKTAFYKEIDANCKFKASSDGKCFVVEQNNKLLCFTYADGIIERVLLFGEYIDLTGIACYDVCGSGLAVVNPFGLITLYNFLTGEIKTISKGVEKPENIQISNDFKYISIWGIVNGYYYYAGTDSFNSYIIANQLFSFNNADNTVNRYFSGNIVSYYLNGNALSYMTMCANFFDGSVPVKNLHHFSNFIAKKGKTSIVIASQVNANMLAFSDFNTESLVLSPSGKYLLVKYTSGALKLFRFNKKIMSFESFKYGEALTSGNYYFLGDDKLLNINKGGAVIYKIIEDKTQLLFKKNGNASAAFYIKERIDVYQQSCKVTINLEAA